MKCSGKNPGDHTEVEFEDGKLCPACDYAENLDIRNEEVISLRKTARETADLAHTLHLANLGIQDSNQALVKENTALRDELRRVHEEQESHPVVEAISDLRKRIG